MILPEVLGVKNDISCSTIVMITTVPVQTKIFQKPVFILIHTLRYLIFKTKVTRIANTN